MTNKITADVGQQLYDLLAESNRVPFLFVGSGISQRYMGTQDWEGLLKWVCSSVGKPMQPFYLYKQRASTTPNNKNIVYPHIATLMEEDFLTATTLPEYSSWVKENEKLFESVHPMKVYIADYLKKSKPIRLKNELELLRLAARHVSGVITTNYDNLMESIFTEYDVYFREEDLLFSPLSSMGEIYKIHGSMDDPNSMVLDEQDYARFEERRNYLLAKIFTVFGEFPIIFLGYSLGDQDIKELLSSIAACAGSRRVKEMSNRFIFVKYSDDPCDPSISPYAQNLDEGRTMTMTQVTAHDFSFIYEAIKKTNQLYAPQMLGQLSKQVFRTNGASKDAESTVFIEFDQLDQLPQDKKVVIGLRADDYGKPISASELYEDVVLDNSNFNATLVVQDYLGRFLLGNPGGLPMFKYLTKYKEHISGKTLLKEINRIKVHGYDSYLSDTLRGAKKNFRESNTEFSVQRLVHDFGDIKACRKLTCLEENEISLDELEQLLKRVMNMMPPNFSESDKNSEYWRYRTEIKRCIRIFDYLKYGKRYLSDK